jgi:hypothetical protein
MSGGEHNDENLKKKKKHDDSEEIDTAPSFEKALPPVIPPTIPVMQPETRPHNKAIASIYGDETTSDIILLPSNSKRKFHAHKHILSSQSKHFYDLFFGEASTKETEIQMNITPQTLTCLLKFVYTIDIVPSSLTTTELVELYSAGNKLGLEALSMHCLACMLSNQVDTTNVCHLWPWLVEHPLKNEEQKVEATKLMEKCKTCVRDHASQIFEARKYLNWTKEFVIDHFLPQMCSKEETREPVDPRKFILKMTCEWIRCNLGVAYDKRGKIASVSPFTSMDDLRATMRTMFKYSSLDLIQGGQRGLQFFAQFFETCIGDAKYLKDEAVLRVYQTISENVL